ncbi:MAG TPA: helix-turn-helix domain-containing protein [Micromonosporaceae bacterium]|nr:helix-turn-helix domain-containing protein [Micromonosporaceae bacterium]
MHKADLAVLPCSLARSLQIVGEWWTMLVLRDICFDVNRFEAIHGHLGIARNILKARLDTLVEHGLAERRRYQTRPDRYEYVATEKGSQLVPVFLAMVAWGDRWAAPDGPPMLFAHAACGRDTVATVVCSECARPLRHEDVTPHAGPGYIMG